MKNLTININELDHVNIKLFKRMIMNINNNINKSIQKSDFNKASKLKYFRILLIKYIKECKYINEPIYLNNILNKIKSLHNKISEITYNQQNDILLDIHFPKFDNEYINLLFIFIYKFSKINKETLLLLCVDYIKKLYYTIQNSGLDNIYSKVSLFDFIINNPNKNLEKFTNFIKTNNYKDKLISYSSSILYPL